MTDLTITRHFAAPRQLVWDGWTKAEHFAAWFGGAAVEVPAETLDYVAEAGRPWSATMVLPGGGTIAWVGEFVEVDAPNHLRLTITDQPQDADRSHLIVDFVDAEGGTEVTMTQSPIPDGAEEALKNGYSQFFDALDAEIERMRG